MLTICIYIYIFTYSLSISIYIYIHLNNTPTLQGSVGSGKSGKASSKFTLKRIATEHADTLKLLCILRYYYQEPHQYLIFF